MITIFNKEKEQTLVIFLGSYGKISKRVLAIVDILKILLYSSIFKVLSGKAKISEKLSEEI